ncbi:MAG: histidine kinase [Flavobacteriales bacterium]|nr:histidine kinase [Flavobacteriales bacterium]
MPEIFQKLFKTIWIQILVVLIISVLAAAWFTGGRVFTEFRVFFWGTLWSATIWITQWFGNGLLTNWLNNKINWIERPMRRLVLGVMLQSLYSTIAILVVCGVFEWIVGGGIRDPWNWALVTSGIAIKISLLISGIFTAMSFFSNWKSKEAEAERLRAEMMSYKYESLRNQLNPHFLFNSFNLLSELVYEDQDLAVRFIGKLSKVYRYVLDSRNKERVTLKEELEFIETYTFLLSTRFEGAFKVHMDVSPTEEQYLVPMSLQLLIENAVKHNELSVQSPLSIEVIQSGNRISVSNPVRPKKVGEDSSGVGLENIVSRYKFFTDDPVQITKDDKFTVSLPILK